MNITVLGLATAGMLLSASAALAVDQGASAQQGGVSTSPGVVGGRVPAETPPATGSLPGSPGPYKSEGASSPPTSGGPSTTPAPSSGSTTQSSGN
jgi:hypothetical protein